MGNVSQYDDWDPATPDPVTEPAGEPETQADGWTQPAADGPGDDGTGWEDTQPIGSADPDEEPTTDQSVWQQPDPQAWPAPEPPQDAAGARPTDTAAWPTSAYETAPYGQAASYSQHGYAPGYPQPDYTGYRQPAQHSGQPGWFWPVVAAIALVVGLLGGTLASVAVSSSMNDGTVDIPVIETDDAVAPPLAADNRSISAVAAKLLPSTVQILAGEQAGEGATGSGFVLDRQGHVITNNHVVAEATDPGELTVVDNDGDEHDAEIVGRSAVYDIAVLELTDPGDLRPAALGSSQTMRIGEGVVAIGSPLGLSATVTSGIVSALDRPVTTGTNDDSSYINAVQTDAAINPGNSGGPLVNLRGQVVGVNSAIATMSGTFSGESGNIGVGFAIPMEQVRVTAAQILQTGEAKYPVIGANVNTGEQRGGAEVVDVPSGTPAAAAGLQEGDVVVRVDGDPVDDGIGLIVAIRSHQPGETIRLTVERGGSEVEVDITLDAKVG